jgi:diguanylate cyclase (GGDEF) domain
MQGERQEPSRAAGVLAAWGGWRSSFTCTVPAHLAERLIRLQHERLRAFLPLLCIIIAANALAMAVSVWGELPVWQQLLPPALIIGTCCLVLAWMRLRDVPDDPETLGRQLHHATLLAAVLGLVAGIWSVNAFEETERYYCMVAPVFIGIAALVCATCLLSVPRAAIAAMAATVSPVVVKMTLFDYLNVRAMAAMVVLVTVMQASVVLAKFRETVRMLAYQDELDRLANTDPLTGLHNRLAFMRALERKLEAGEQLAVLLADLDGFKPVNDAHGHQAGDAVLVEVAARLRQLCSQATSIARLGGDEFAILVPLKSAGALPASCDPHALRAAILLPVTHGDTMLRVDCSFGLATAPADGRRAKALLHAADMRLYEHKAEKPERRAA